MAVIDTCLIQNMFNRLELKSPSVQRVCMSDLRLSGRTWRLLSYRLMSSILTHKLYHTASHSRVRDLNFNTDRIFEWVLIRTECWLLCFYFLPLCYFLHVCLFSLINLQRSFFISFSWHSLHLTQTSIPDTDLKESLIFLLRRNSKPWVCSQDYSSVL
jgi:hypothetical protein